jgi:hypothetical protein
VLQFRLRPLGSKLLLIWQSNTHNGASVST